MNESLDLSGNGEKCTQSILVNVDITPRTDLTITSLLNDAIGPLTSTPRKPNIQPKAGSSTAVNDVSGNDQTYVALPTPAKQIYMFDTCGNKY